MGASVPTVKHANLFEPEDDSRISVTGCVLFKQPVSKNRPLTQLQSPDTTANVSKNRPLTHC